MTILKRSMSFLLTLVMLFTMVPLNAFAAAEITEVVTEVGKVEQTAETTPPEEAEILPQAEGTGEIPVTRAQWLQLLVQTFSMTVEDGVYPDNYFVDLDSGSEYYYDMLLAVEFGVVDIPVGGYLHPEEAATREFAAVTLNYCLGFQPDPEKKLNFSESGTVANPYDLQTAIDRGWFALVDGAFLPEQPITRAEAEFMAADAATVLAAGVIDEDFDSIYTYTTDVVEVPDGTRVEATEEGIVIYNNPVTIAAGDVFVVYFEGIPCLYLAENVQNTASRTILTVSTVDEGQYYENVEAQGAVDAKFTDFIPEEDTEVLYIDEDTGEEYTDPAAAERAMALRVQSMASPHASGEVKLNRTIKVKRSMGAYGIGGYVEVELKNPKVQYDISLSRKKVIVKVISDVDIHYGVEADLAAFKKLDDIPIGFIGVEGVGGIEISIVMEAKAALHGSISGNVTNGLEFADGTFRLIKEFNKKSFSLVAEFSGKIGLCFKLGVNDVPADAIEGYVYTEVGAKGNVKIMQTDDLNCTHVAFYLYRENGFKASVKLGFYKKSWEETETVWGEDNSPLRVVHHYENGVLVPGCTLNGNDYYTPTESPYWSSNWSGGNNSIGYNSKGQPVQVFDYTLDTAGNATIISYIGSASSLTVPDTLDGHPVVAINDRVFEGHTELRSIIIPDSVTTLEYRAFANCTNLTSVKLSDNLEYMSGAVFLGCSALPYIEIPASLNSTYGTSHDYDGIFYGCDNLKTVVLEPGMTQIPESLFVGANSIETFVMPDSITSIGNYAFCSASGLKHITFSENLMEIGQYAFMDCTALETIELPDSVTTLWHYAFWNCTALKEVKLSENLETISEGAFSCCTSLPYIKIPATLKNYQGYCADKTDGVFYGCTNLKNVELEEGIQTVPMGLFVGADSIESIVLPDSVITIENYAFNYNQGLKQITFSNSLTKIGEYAFRLCTSLEKVEIPDTVTTLGHYAFASCTNLKEVKMSENLKLISPGTFCYCTSLTSIKIPSTLTKVNKSSSLFLKASEGVFYGCVNLKNVELEEGLPLIADSLFMGAPAIETLVIPASVTEIQYRAFYSCTGLVELVIPETVTSIAEYVFEECTGLQTVTWLSSLTTIPKYTFSKCTDLETVNLPDNLEAISGYAFFDCDSLVTFIMPESVTALNSCTFYDCNNLAEIELSPNITKLNSMTFRYCNSLKSITLPDGITSLGDNCFEGCTSLSAIGIPDSVTAIGMSAFSDCDSLTAIIIPSGVTTIGNRCFKDCDALVSVEMADSVSTLGTGCFQSCDMLKDVKLSRNLSRIPTDAFRECGVLEEIVIPYFAVTIDANAFNSSPKLIKVVTHPKLTSIASNAFSYTDRVAFYGTTGSYTQTWCESNGYTFNENTVTATSVTMAESALTLRSGQTQMLNVIIDPADFCDSIIFKSGNTAVATVDETGKVTAVAPGTAVIKIIVGSASASCKVTVTQAVTKIALNKSTLALDVPNTYQLVATITPTDASNKVLTWTSSNEAAATVDENGLITAVGNGTAVITATATDGSGISASCTVTVTDPTNIPVSGISLDKTSLSLEALETYRLTVTISPADAANKNLRWTSSNEAVATVDQNGNITAVAKGTAVITAAATDESGVTAACTVTVTNTAYVATNEEQLESPHKYSASCTDFWLYSVSGAKELYVTFDERTNIEDGFDYLHIYDGDGNLVGTYTGTELAGQTITVPGDTVKIQLDTDDSGNEWGFKVTELKADMPFVVIASGWSGATQWTLTSDNTLTFYGSGNMKDYGWSGGQPWAPYVDQITEVIIEEGIARIGSGAFKDMTALESVTLPETGLTKIGIAAFYGCTSLKAITIPEGIYTIWEYTFKNCSSISAVRLPKTLIKIDQGAFEACTTLPELYLPTNVEIIGGWSFKGCTALTRVDMQWSDVTRIRPGAFKNCTALTEIILPVNIQILGDSCFYGIGATTFTVPDTVTAIEDWCFARSALKEIIFEGNAPTIGQGAFNKISLTAYYPSGNSTWTASLRLNYGGTVLWKAK